MKYLFTTIVFFYLFASLSCNKDNMHSDIDLKLTLTHTEIENIGITHNRLVRESFKNTSFKDGQEVFLKDYKNYFKNYFDNTEIAVFSEDDFLKIPSEDPFENLKVSELTIDYYNDIIETVEDPKMNLAEIHKTLDFIKQQVYKNVNLKSETEMLLIALSVAKNSTKLWFPIQEGGEGFADELSKSLITTREDDEKSKKKKVSAVKKVVRNDISGAVVGLGKVAICVTTNPACTAAASTPVGNAAVAGTIAGSAALSSGLTTFWLIFEK